MTRPRWAPRRPSTPRTGCPTAPSGAAEFENQVAWSGELGYGVRAPEQGQAHEDVVVHIGTGHDDHGHGDHGHDDHDDHDHGGGH